MEDQFPSTYYRHLLWCDAHFYRYGIIACSSKWSDSGTGIGWPFFVSTLLSCPQFTKLIFLASTRLSCPNLTKLTHFLASTLLYCPQLTKLMRLRFQAWNLILRGTALLVFKWPDQYEVGCFETIAQWTYSHSSCAIFNPPATEYPSDKHFFVNRFSPGLLVILINMWLHALP